MGALDAPSVVHKPALFQFRKRTWRKARLDNCETLESNNRCILLDPPRGSELVRASDRAALTGKTGHCSHRGMYDTTGLAPWQRVGVPDVMLDPLWSR